MDLFSYICRITRNYIFSQYKKKCEIISRLLKKGWEDKKDYVKKDISNILHANIDVHSRRFIAEFPGYGVKCISKIQSHCANITFSDKSRYYRLFQIVTHKGG